MTAYLTWPLAILPPQSETLELVAGVTSGGDSMAGDSQTTESTGGPRWSLSLSVLVSDEDGLGVWGAIEGLLQNGLRAMIIPLSLRRIRAVFWPGAVTHDDNSAFDDDSLYVGSITGVLDAAALRATTVNVTLASPAPRAGDLFTIVHTTKGPRLYRLLRDLGGGDFTITPPLREAIADGDEADFSNPRCVMKLSDPRGMQIAIESDGTGDGQPLFVETGVAPLSA